MILFNKFSFYLAILGIIAAVVFSMLTRQPIPQPVYVQKPTASPFVNFIGASGIVESVNKNISIGVPEEGIVTRIWHVEGDRVKKGEPLFEIDTRVMKANIISLKAAVEVAKATLEKMEDRLKRLETINDPRAISTDELQNQKNEFLVAKAEIEVALANIKEKEALIERNIVRAPIDGTILSQEIRVGQFINNSKSAIIFGNLDHLQLRVSIDEESARYFDQNMPAVAYPKNDTTVMIPLQFKRIEPYVIPKKELTGDVSEKIDTRVLQVFYNFSPPEGIPIFVGQQMDAYIEKKGEEHINE